MAPENTDFKLIQTKLNHPRVDQDFVTRSRLNKKLNQSISRPLTLISAPAGYGKTTLVSSWLETWDSSSTWLSLDERDSHLTTFLNYFLAAIQSIFPEACNESALLLKATSLPPVPFIAGSVLNDLNEINQPFVLVLDDYHTIHEKAIHEFLSELLRYPPENMHLILITRHNPILPVASMRAKGTLSEIRSHDLRLTIPEIAAVLKQMIKVDVDESTAVLFEEKTEGWVTGLRLAVISALQKKNISSIESALQRFPRYTFDYLMSEVFSNQSPKVQSFLIQSSIFDRLCLSLCETVIESNEPDTIRQIYQDEVLKNNIFLSALDDEQQWYRYHDLFQKFLQRQLENHHSSDEIIALHIRAANWFVQNGLIEEALKHRLKAGDTAGAVRLLAQHRPALMNKDQWQRLNRWYNLFPDDVVDTEPELLILNAWLKQVQWKYVEMQAVFERIESLQTSHSFKGKVNHHLQSEIELLQESRVVYASPTESAIANIKDALAKIPTEHYYIRGYAATALGSAYQLTHNLEAAEQHAAEGLLELPKNDLFHTRMLGMLAIVYWMEGDLVNLFTVANRCLEISQQAGAVLALAAMQHFLGCIQYHHNDLAAAEQSFRYVFDHGYLANTIVFAHSAIGLASTYQAQNQPDKASEVLDSATAFLQETDNTLLLPVAQAFQAELAAQQGRLAEANQWVTRASFSPPRMALPGFYNPQLALPKILLAQNTTNSLNQIAEYLSKLRIFLETINNKRFMIETLALQALVHSAQGNQTTALEILEQSVTMAEPCGYIRPFVDLGIKLEPLLAQLAENEVTPAYISKILFSYEHFEKPDGSGPSTEVVSQRKLQSELTEMMTNREMDVLLLLAERKTNKEIARELGISPETVKRHTVNLYQKLDVHNRRQAVVRAQQLGILP
jgi:LuxR family maltose regulon positive regulatory protein